MSMSSRRLCVRRATLSKLRGRLTSYTKTGLQLEVGLSKQGPLARRPNTTNAAGQLNENYTISANIYFTSVCHKLLTWDSSEYGILSLIYRLLMPTD
jgi:hypothetical protein